MEKKFYSVLGTIACLSAFGSILIEAGPLRRVATIMLLLSSFLAVVLYFRHLLINRKKNK